MCLLVVVDESEDACVRSICGIPPASDAGRMVTLFYVLKPMPRVLLEHGGSEYPEMEQLLSARLREERQAWLKHKRESECPILEPLCHAGACRL